MTRTNSDRRKFLAASGTALTIAVAGCLGGDDDDDGNGDDVPDEIADHLSDANNYDGNIEDMTGEDEITIDNGVGDEPAEFAFEPALVRVDEGTTITWSWVSDGHNVEEVEGDRFESDVQDAGETFEYTVEESGNILYQCFPHAEQGHLGAVIVE